MCLSGCTKWGSSDLRREVAIVQYILVMVLAKGFRFVQGRAWSAMKIWEREREREREHIVFSLLIFSAQ